MRTSLLAIGVAGVLGLSFPAADAAPPAKAKKRPAHPPVISSHQIDRYDAIMKTKARLEQDPKSLADWIILGELAHEVAMNLPEAQARDYLRSSREAYEHALALAPNNPGLKAATQFARDMEANHDQFEKARDRSTDPYLEARRRDLALSNYTPAVAVYNPPAAATDPVANANVAARVNPANNVEGAPAPIAAANPPVVANPPVPNTAAEDTANFGTRQFYGPQTYRPFLAAPGAVPFTYQEYNSAYFAPGSAAAGSVPPVSLQRFSQEINADRLREAPAPIAVPR